MTSAFLIMKGNEYLVCMVERFTGSGKKEPKFSMHKYDAARIPEREQAKHIIRCLEHPGEEWRIVRFNPLNGEVKPA